MSFGDDEILMVNDPQRRILIYDQIAQYLPAFESFRQGVMVVTVQFDNKFLDFGLTLESHQVVDVEVIDLYLALELCVYDGEEGFDGDLQWRSLLFEGDFLPFVEGWVNKQTDVVKQIFLLFDECTSVMLSINVFVYLVVNGESIVAFVFGQKFAKKA